MDDPLALRNIRKGDSPGAISGLEYLQEYHRCTSRFRKGNESHPFRIAERADTWKWLKAYQAAHPAADGIKINYEESLPVKVYPVKVYPQKRTKKPAPQPDADGKYRL